MKIFIMNRKKKACKKPQTATKPIVVDSENSSEEITRLRAALAQLQEENKRLKAAQAHTDAKEVSRLNKELEFEYIRAEAFKTMIEVAESTFNIPILKKRGTK